MSRCFPYPPPGYTLSRGSKEPLIESIKLQKERQKAKEQKKKEKRREKKEKKKDKKDKNKEKKEKTHLNDKTCQSLGEFNVVQGHSGNKFWADTKGKFPCRGSGSDPEQLERSSLTEEHGQPGSLRVPSSSSDSTENSNKRKRHSSPVDAARGHGKIIRIRLSSKGGNQSNEQQVCSTSGRIHPLGHSKGDIDPRCNRENLCCTSEVAGNMVQGLALRTDGEQICSTSQQSETVAAAGKTQIPRVTSETVAAAGKTRIPHMTSETVAAAGKTRIPHMTSETVAAAGKTRIPHMTSETVAAAGKTCIPHMTSETVAAAAKARTPHMTKMQRVELQYKNLMENSVPPQLRAELPESEDLDWLLPGKNHLKNAQKRQISSNDSMSCISSSELFPRAKYLQEVDVYALPFTVPF